jgi:hypothetical protein
MDKQNSWLSWAIELQSLAQAGLTYGHDPYDLERYKRIREISAEMVAHKSDIPAEKVKELFCNETGYQTPKVDTRAAFSMTERFCSSTNRTAHGRSPAAGAM